MAIIPNDLCVLSILKYVSYYQETWQYIEI